MTSLAGTGTLFRLILRRDRVRIPLLVLVTFIVVAAGVPGLRDLYPTAEARAQLARSVSGNPAFLAIYGPPTGFDGVGGIVAWRFGFFLFLIAGLAGMFMVIRHTRDEEEAGRADLTGSAVLGRHARLTAALLAVGLLDLLLGVAIVIGMLGSGEPLGAVLAFAAAIAGTGFLLAGVAAIAAQVTESARAARGIAASAFGLLFALRAAGDAAGLAWLTWVSPLGWVERTRAFAGPRWWVIGLMLVTAVALAAAAAFLGARRDVGAGLVRPRPGPADAAPSLSSPLGLAWRLQRGSLIGWTIGFAWGGLLLGAIAEDVGDLVEGNQAIKDALDQMGGAGALVDTYMSAVLGVMGLIAAGYAVSATLRLRSEETETHAEVILATGVSRWRWAGAHILIAALGTVVLMLTVGLVTGLVHGLRSGDLGGQLPGILVSALVQVPAVWVVAGVTVALFGLLPRLTVLAWVVLGVFLVMGQLGAVLGLSQGVLDISPFTHPPRVPVADFSATPVLWLTAVALALALAGLSGFRRRDLG
jgi:ABC-2 type transport system permease protein